MNESKKEIKVASIKSNYIFNTLRTVLNLVVPLIVFPYTSRVLGPEGLGSVEFANSIVSYFVLFTALGIPTYGIREIARTRDSLYERSKTFWELTWILGITVIAGYICYFFMVFFVPVFKARILLFLIVCPTIFLSDFSYEWFYIGIEDQKYITQRYVFIKILQIVLVFLCIKKVEHFYRYAAIIIGLNGVSTLFNIVRIRRYVSFIHFKELNIVRHIKPSLVIFASIVAVNVYTHLDVTMVGLISGDRAVGLYTAANKVVRIVIQLVTSLGIVMVPRIENCFKKGDMNGYRKGLWLSLRFVFLLGVPSLVGIELLAPEIIWIFAGEQYMEAVVSIRLLSPIILIVGLAHFMGLQILYTNRKENIYAVAVTIAALVNGIFNYFMIHAYSYNGAVVGTLVAETTGLVIMSIVGRKYLADSRALGFDIFKYIFASAVMAGILVLVKPFAGNYPVGASLVMNVVLGAFVYFISLVLLRDKCIREVFKKK